MEPEVSTVKGLDQIFSPSSPAPEASKASPEPKAEVEKTEVPVAEVKAAEEVKTDPAAEKKPEEAPKADEKPVEAKPPEEKKTEAPKIDWDSADNPYRKRYEDTRDYATKVNGDTAELKRQMAILHKKLDGTYDPEKDEAKPPSPDEIKREAEIQGKLRVAEKHAKEKYGEQEFEAKLSAFNARFGKDPFVQQRVLNSDDPYGEAFQVMEEVAIVEKYKTRDPNKILAAVRKEVEEELREKIREEESKKIMARLDKKELLAPSLTGVRGAGKDDGAKAPAQTPLNSIFSH